MKHSQRHARCVAALVRLMIEESSLDTLQRVQFCMEGKFRPSHDEHNAKMKGYELQLAEILANIHHEA